MRVGSTNLRTMVFALNCARDSVRAEIAADPYSEDIETLERRLRHITMLLSRAAHALALEDEQRQS